MHIYNTLTQTLDLFEPLQAPDVRMYVCGVTVYDLCHIGHARAYVNFDTMRRVLTHSGYNVKYIQNFTDIDDKIIARAQELGISTQALTEGCIADYFQDMDQLNIMRAMDYPKATDYLPQMIAMIAGLIEKGAAYASGGDVFYRISAFPTYGKLSKKVLEDLVVGKRVDPSDKKQHPLDFVLWKSAKPGEPTWESPWGPGRPGWHIECSAMALQTLGETLDIHGGGEDLIFPHHENEICQSESFTGKTLARYWVHNGFVTLKNEKMSKSLKNFFTLREVLKEFSGEVIRFFLLKVHYRSPLNFSFDGLKEAKSAYQKLCGILLAFPPDQDAAAPDAQISQLRGQFEASICQDFNFTEAIGFLFEMRHHIRATGQGSRTLWKCGQLLGLFMQPMAADVQVPPAHVLALGEARATAKKARDFAQADALRSEIAAQGWVVEDTPQGLRWKQA